MNRGYPYDPPFPFVILTGILGLPICLSLFIWNTDHDGQMDPTEWTILLCYILPMFAVLALDLYRIERWKQGQK